MSLPMGNPNETREAAKPESREKGGGFPPSLKITWPELTLFLEQKGYKTARMKGTFGPGGRTSLSSRLCWGRRRRAASGRNRSPTKPSSGLTLAGLAPRPRGPSSQVKPGSCGKGACLGWPQPAPGPGPLVHTLQHQAGEAGRHPSLRASATAPPVNEGAGNGSEPGMRRCVCL